MARVRGTIVDDCIEDVFVNVSMWEHSAGLVVEIAGESLVRRVLMWRLMKKRDNRDRVEAKLQVRTEKVRSLMTLELDKVVGGLAIHKSITENGFN
jgi:hypothetical protein